jgi:hypothetical protein
MLELSLIIPDELKKNKKLLRALAVVNSLPARGAKTELQIPELMQRALIKFFGRRAWPEAVTDGECNAAARSCALRKIVLGLWLEKAKKRPAIYKLNFVVFFAVFYLTICCALVSAPLNHAEGPGFGRGLFNCPWMAAASDWPVMTS